MKVLDLICTIGHYCFARRYSKCHCDVDYNAPLLVSAAYTSSHVCILTPVDSIVQGADWHFGPTKPTNKDADPDPRKYIKDTALVTGILSLILFVCYLAYQVLCREINSITELVIMSGQGQKKKRKKNHQNGIDV